ncbi:unnamed protein product [Polarella glacialis]|uniref:Phosphotyrosine protein phosphatase I domain-containing protein n=1 Tax=Polarella glacialis TaxID=89957 RepID=A0A813LHK9_POLGL|nr:unnamed protein product [Polarella glacialis]
MAGSTWGPQYKHNVMFLCNHNSCRSQMADGWLRTLRDANVGVASAGIVGGTAVKEGAIVVMKEAGVDISSYSSDAMADFKPEDFDIVISCCGCGSKLDGEHEAWKKQRVFEDWNLDDPPAIDPGDLSAYRRVRDEGKAKVEQLLASLKDSTWGPQYKHNVMFLCNHNSCRSQMADGWLRTLRDANVGVASAGIVGGTAVKEGAIVVMKEAGVDISSYSSDAMADFKPEDFDIVISCCGCGSKLDGEHEAWKKQRVFEDWNLDDPPAIDPGDLSAYRRVRDEGKAKVEQLLASLKDSTWGPQYKHNVMFLCNHNSCRSQMADGWLRTLRDANVGVASAGIVGGTAVKEGAIVVMKEAGVDVSSYSSDAMADFKPEDFDIVISCCGCGSKLDGEHEAWKKQRVFEDWNLDDPPAIDPGDLSAYRRVRDEGKAKVEQLLASLKDSTWGPQYKHNVMFLCNHNSCRSQMADGWLRTLRDANVGVASAGIVGGTAVKEGAIVVMKEAGVDISSYSSDAMADFKPEDFDIVISCCGCGSKLDGEHEAWKKQRVFEDWNLDDPPAIDPGDLSAYRRVRDEGKAKVEQLLASLKDSA